MKLNLDKNVMDLRGNPVAAKLSDLMANALATSTIGKPAKMITWAVNLTNNGEIEVDISDLQFLHEYLENKCTSIVNLAKVQILDEIERIQKG